MVLTSRNSSTIADNPHSTHAVIHEIISTLSQSSVRDHEILDELWLQLPAIDNLIYPTSMIQTLPDPLSGSELWMMSRKMTRYIKRAALGIARKKFFTRKRKTKDARHILMPKNMQISFKSTAPGLRSNQELSSIVSVEDAELAT